MGDLIMATELGTFRFTTAQRGHWMWQQVTSGGDVLLASGMAFPSIEECAVDARREGYAGAIADYAARE